MPPGTANSALTEAVFYILLALYKEPMHGYGIMQEAQAMSGGRVTLGPGTLYGAINTLLEKRWIVAADGGSAMSRKKAYVLTQHGRDALEAERLRLAELLRTVEQVMGGKAQ